LWASRGLRFRDQRGEFGLHVAQVCEMRPQYRAASRATLFGVAEEVSEVMSLELNLTKAGAEL
jgi:hypothetical protein